MELNKIYNEDCFELFKRIPDGSIDCVICDLPYGTTNFSWDTIIPLEPMWLQIKRIRKENVAICLFGSEPFSSALRMSNVKEFKYDWIWNKKLAGNGILAKKQPLKIHENIIIFNKHNYYPKMEKGKARYKNGFKSKHKSFKNAQSEISYNDQYYPNSIIEFSGASMRRHKLHPTQKPVSLIQYLIKTYTKENELILDFCIGSGTTAVAAKQNNRNFIGSEISPEYCKIANERLKQEYLF